jgi:hypothetical protein
MNRNDLLRRVQEYASQQSLVLGQRLGDGMHGIVFAASHQTKQGGYALKVHERSKEYLRERDVYVRLQELGVTNILGCRVPELLAFDDTLSVIAITIVERPFVLDFAGAYLDHAPDFSDEVLPIGARRKRSNSGADGPMSRRSCGVSRATAFSCST